MADEPEPNPGGVQVRHRLRQQRPLRSIESRIHSYIRFVNRTQRSVDLFWIDYAGERRKYTTLRPGDHYKLNTFVTHPFIFRDAETSAKLIVNSEEVYYPRPWNEGQLLLGPAMPWHVTEYIIIPLYTLKERAIQVVRSCLKDPKEAYTLDIPQSLMTAIAEYMSGKDKLENVNPHIFAKAGQRVASPTDWDDDVYDPFDSREIFDLVRNIRDPEHPLSLEELNVVEEGQCEVSDDQNSVMVHFTPTIPHCSMASLIGLSIRLKLLQALPTRFKVDVRITPGTHSSEHAINKQLADKERVAAALENPHLLEVINKCLHPRSTA